MKSVTIDSVELHLMPSDELPLVWAGREDLMRQVLAAWLLVGSEDLPMNPRLVGKPGVGKTTLAYAAGKAEGKEVWLFQATMDTRPEDLIVTPVVGPNGSIRYVASPIVSAMIEGGVAVLDEGNRMSEKAWASLAPLLDQRRYVESIVCGVKIRAHPDFRFVATMNEDASTFDVPEYIHSRLEPQVFIDFPDAEEEFRILKQNLPYSDDEVLSYVVTFLQVAHAKDEPFTVRDGVNIARYAIKRGRQAKRPTQSFLSESIRQILGEHALRYGPKAEP